MTIIKAFPQLRLEIVFPMLGPFSGHIWPLQMLIVSMLLQVSMHSLTSLEGSFYLFDTTLLYFHQDQHSHLHMVGALHILFKNIFQTFQMITESAFSLIPYFKEPSTPILYTSKKENAITYCPVIQLWHNALHCRECVSYWKNSFRCVRHCF